MPESEWIELLPAGRFYTNDGRGPFQNDDPQAVIRLSRQLQAGGLPIDFDHATDRAAPQGLPAPAAGWIREFRVVAGAIMARVEWTPRGAAAVKGKEYRFISPVFEFDPPAGSLAGAETGRVVRIKRAGLTNNPALSQLPAIAASRRPGHETFVGTPTLTADQLAMCRQLGTDPAVFATRLADRQAGRPMVLSSQTRGDNQPTGLIGPAIVDEAFDEFRTEIEKPSMDARMLVQEATAAIDQFMRQSAAPDGWKILGRAAAMLVGAIDRIGPPYADRVRVDAATKEIKWR